MKKMLIFFVAAVSIIACKQREVKSAGEQIVNPIEDSANYTSIQWIDSTYIDLGTVKEGPEVEVAYKFKNVGNKPLVISDVSASCGCTVPEKPKEPYAPGEEGTIKAKFTTSGHTGVNNKTITVTANTKGTTTYPLEFHIVVEKK
jgi:hypothetical protein